VSLSEGTRLGAYVITGQIGAGGMGEVYRATDSKLGRDVAIKTLPAALATDDDRLARFEREAKLLAALNHPHIASVYSLDEHEGTLYLAMELVEGETLEEKLKAGALPLDDALRLALQIAEALEAAHEKSVVHRDLKPANVMLTPEGQVKVLDFGLAKAFAGQTDETSPLHSPALSLAMTQAGLVLGTAGYMSPEQASGQATDQRADVWAFGVVLYEMLTGLPLFSGESVPHILADVLRAEPDWNRLPRNLHPRLRLMLERCLEKKPRNRYHSIADARVDIEKVLGDPQGITPVPTAQAAVPARSLAGRLASAGGIAIAGAAVAGLLAWSFWPSPAPPRLTRFTYALPEGHSLRRVAVPVMALSPDGRHFVYNTTQGFYLRSLDQLEARLIPGTEEDSALPFFSPDGQSLGYVAPSGGVERIAITGGASVVVGDRSNIPLGASWEEDGTIFYSQPDGIHRVPATGGTLELVIPAEQAEWLVGPSLLPDGDSLLFSVSGSSGSGAGEIVVQSLSTGERMTLFSGGDDPRYVPTGHIVYAFEDGLFGVAFDAETLSVSGGPVPLVQGVMRASQSPGANYGIAEDGTLVYVSGSATAGTRTLVWVDRDGGEEPIPIEPSNYAYPRISPNGRRVALDDRNADGDLWVWDFAAQTRTRLTVGDADGEYPVWTPDGARIAFSGASNEIQWKAANNTGATETLSPADIIAGSANPSPYFFSPAGSELVFRDQENPDTDDNIGMISVGGDAEPVWLLSGPYRERNAELSPDGRSIAYQSDESGRWEIYVRPFPNVDDDRALVSNNGGRFPLWSRDGRELYYLEGQLGSLRLMAVSVEPTGTSFAFTGRDQLIEWPYYAGGEGRSYDVSAAGRFLAISEGGPQGSNEKIIVVENWVEELRRLVPTQ
jgi:Tol biopolymer transport system component